MSSALVLAAVTAILKNMLENGLVERGVTSALGSETLISALPPDRISTGPDEKVQMNIFLYQVATKGLYTASRHAPRKDAERLLAAPQALELHYLLTAYGVEDIQAEILLGYALELFHQSPILTAPMIQKTLATMSSPTGGRLVPPVLAALAAAELPAQLCRIKIQPHSLESEEMVNLWSAFQVSFRPSVPYRVSVELAGARVSEADL